MRKATDWGPFKATVSWHPTPAIVRARWPTVYGVGGLLETTVNGHRPVLWVVVIDQCILPPVLLYTYTFFLNLHNSAPHRTRGLFCLFLKHFYFIYLMVTRQSMPYLYNSVQYCRNNKHLQKYINFRENPNHGPLDWTQWPYFLDGSGQILSSWVYPWDKDQN